MEEKKKKMFEEHIDAHLRMIKFHRQQILDLRRKIKCFEKKEMIPIGLEIKNES